MIYTGLTDPSLVSVNNRNLCVDEWNAKHNQSCTQHYFTVTFRHRVVCYRLSFIGHGYGLHVADKKLKQKKIKNNFKNTLGCMLQQKLLAGAVKNAHKTRENRVQDWACWGWGVV